MSAITSTAKRPVLLWIIIGYWMLSGIISIVSTFFFLTKFDLTNLVTILFVLINPVSGVLSLWAGVLLVRNMKLTIIPMIIVFLLGIVAALLAGPGYLAKSLDSYAVVLWAIVPLSILYAHILRKRGVLK